MVTKLAKVLKLTLASSSVAGGDGGGSDVENSGHVDVVPLFLCEGVSAKKEVLHMRKMSTTKERANNELLPIKPRQP